MPNCDGLLTADILNDCENPSIGGLEANVLLFNTSDINKAETTYNSTNKLLVTNFELKPEKIGYLLESVKQIHALKFEYVKKELGLDKYKHTFSFVILTPNVANRNKLHEMNGGRFTVMVQTLYKGVASAEQFLIGGYDSGMELQIVNYASNENDGTISVELSSVENYEEPKPVLTFLDTDASTSQTAFTNKFSTITPP
jgi:hypothetical protein